MFLTSYKSKSLMQSCTYSGQLQVNLRFCGGRALTLRRECGRRGTRTGNEQDQDAAREQHDMHFHFTQVELERPSLNTWRWKFWLMGKPFKWLLWLTEAEGSLRQCCGIREGFAESGGHRKNNSFIVMWQCLVSISASYRHEMQIQGWNQSFD